MTKNENQVRDPVCGMLVDPEERQVEYQQMHFAFCSEQCRERFLANPGLYVGAPGVKAPKQEQRVVLKERRIHLEAPLPPHLKARLQEVLQAMMGMASVHISDEVLEVRYDLLQATAQQIEAVIARTGAELGAGWVERIHRSFVHFIEEEQLASMEVRPPGGHGH
ncbi:MAG: YHS domain-containing protein [Gammaproteobacteria bacterium]